MSLMSHLGRGFRARVLRGAAGFFAAVFFGALIPPGPPRSYA